MVSLPGRVSLDDVDDRGLASRSSDGDIRAFEVLVRRYEQLLGTYALRVLGSAVDVDDVVQEAFIAAWQQLPTMEDFGAVRGWLITIVTRKSIDRLRARHEHSDIDEVEIEARSDGPDVTASANSLDEALSKALSALPPDQRRCWLLREVAGYGYDRIAQELGLPVSTVRGLLARSRKSLVREMEAWR
ncbi:RNA polymerase sigma factor [Naasia lichenicola]|uniref:RNA polymerase sigma factor n=1 Tax=Naasia lichenicola TaxID=2565933 RepID=A0A4S4FLF2_9MICO|nr:RNA polymerase sigma factor [Naasia lichenicola]THG30046.1 RNA polymerase sigma factor [Naasia lichenicola]